MWSALRARTNPLATTSLHGLGDFFSDVADGKLPDHGVFYVRGGYGNIAGQVPADPNPAVRRVDGRTRHGMDSARTRAS